MKAKLVMKLQQLTRAIALTICIFTQLKTRADPLGDWGNLAGAHLSQNAPTFFAYWRGWVMVHVAEFDAANAAIGGFTPYALNVSAPGASPEAAVAQAAYTILTNIGQVNIAALDAALANSLAAIPAGPAKDDGIRIGKLAGETIIKLRSADSPDLSISPPTSSTTAGRWRPTPPNFSSGFGYHGKFIAPWTMRSASQFRPGPPPALTSALYTKDYDEVRVVGSRANTNRSAAEADSALSQESGEDYLSDIESKKPLALLESSRRRALIFMAGMDAIIQAFEAKYIYNFWRPVTAVRSGATDGNDSTVGDGAWTPFLDTHNHPEYPSLLVGNLSAMFEVMISLHGDDLAFSSKSFTSEKTRSFARLSDYIDDAVTARVVGGTHFRNSCTVAAAMGRDIAQNAFANFLRPVPNVVEAKLNNGQFNLTLSAGRALPYVIETSSDLITWQNWRTNLSNTITESDSTQTGDRRFYRTIPHRY
jgi:hypothetical protein